MRLLAIAAAKGVALGILVAALVWVSLYFASALFFGGPNVLGLWLPGLMFFASVIVGALFAARHSPPIKLIAGTLVGSVLAAVAVVGVAALPGIHEGSIWSIVFPTIALGGALGAFAASFSKACNVAL